MKRKSLILMLLMAIGLPWAANAQNTITLSGSVTQTIEPNTTYNFYDSGGPSSNYGTSQNYTATLTCVSDITINFSQFATESSSSCYDWDHMHIYDGDASTGTLLARGQTDCSSATLTTGVDYVASSGTMTIVWNSDVSTTAAGWAATITGGAAPSCLRPTNLTCTEYTATSAKLAWDDANGATSWQYLTLAHGATPDWTSERVITSNTHANVPANIYACTGEQPLPNTEYDFYVRANCGDGDYSEAAMLTFRTACGTITSFPWTEDFNDYTATSSSATTATDYPDDVLPDCWTFLNRSESSSSYPQAFLSSYSSYAVSGNCLFFKSSSSTPIYAVLPEFGTDIAGLELSFTYRNEGTGTSNGTLYVSYMTDPNDASTFNTENAVVCAQTTSKTPMEVVFPNAPAGSYFAFKYQGGSYNNYYLAIDDVAVEELVYVIANQIVNTPVNEFQMTWHDFAEHVNAGHRFIDAIYLMEDITITEMVGTEAKPFTGTFNGFRNTITANITSDERAAAPFHYIKDATIKNLEMTGSVVETTTEDAGYHVSGLVGYAWSGTNTIENCRVSTNITITTLGGGIVGHAKSSTINLIGCVYDGTITNAVNSTDGNRGVGGLIGWCDAATLNITNSIYNGTYTENEGVSVYFHPVACKNGGSTVTTTLYNCYYFCDQETTDPTPTSNNVVTTAARKAYTITGTDPVGVAMSANIYDYYNVGEILGYTPGIMYNGAIIAGEGETVTLTLSGAAGYEADHGTLVANGETFNLTMEAYNTVISGVSCPVPYNVAATNVTAHGAQITWTGSSDSYTVQYREVITAPVDVDVTYDFEDGTQGWTTIDGDGHGDAWSRSTSGGYNSSNCMKATYNSNYAHQDYLVSPQITLGGSFSFYAKKGGSFADKFRVYLSTGGNTNTTDFTVELTNGDVTPSTTYEQYTYDLSAYSGMGYVAIVYTAAADQLSLYVDDITFTNYIDGEYGEWQTVNNATSPQTLGSLTDGTTYQVKVSGICDGVETDESEVVEFTTIIYKHFVTDGNWNEANNWVPAGVPEEGEDVFIDANVTIPANYLANVGHITNNGTITIADGGQLRHTNAHDSEDVITVTLEKVIRGYEDVNIKSGYYFIAPAPFYNTISPNSVTNLKTNNYDFYSFAANASDGLEWINLHNSSNSLKSAHGYLYANSETVTLRSTGQANSIYGGASVQANYYDTDYEFNGWNLAGNPFVCNSYVYVENNNQIVEADFYRMNDDGDGYDMISSTDPVKPYEGVLLYTETSGTVRFSINPIESNNNGKLNMNLNRNGKRIDMARVRFGEGQNLGKKSFRDNSSKVYMTIEGKDYASVFSTETIGEMPVSFKAETNGTYSLSFTNEEVSFSYLHLIDNMTGIETDLLANPNYSFEAKTTDYESRFKLVFVCGDANDDNDFAFFSNGSFVINNEGEATLQVIDINGRILKSESINGCANVNVKAAQGVYMLRLVNGNDVKVQKVVVR